MKRREILLAAILLLTPAMAYGTFSDDFDDGDYDGWTVGFGEWSAVTGRLVHIGTTPGVHSATIYRAHGDPSYRDYEIHYDVYPDENGDLDSDILFRVEVLGGGEEPYPASCYRILVKRAEVPPEGNTYRLWRHTPSWGAELLVEGPELPETPYYHVRVLVQESPEGTFISADVSGVPLVYCDDVADRPLFGGMGFRSWGTRLGQGFDDVSVSLPTTATEAMTWGGIKRLWR